MSNITKEFQSEAEVLSLYEETKREVVIFEGSVYDVSEYKDNHPGGGSLFNDWFGKSIDDPFEEEGHSKAARLVFRDLPLVGYLSGAKKDGTSRQPTGMGGSQIEATLKIDYDKSMASQLWNYKGIEAKEYIQWVNEPKHLINPVRDVPVFTNYFMELWSKTPWYVVIIGWTPLILYEMLIMNQLNWLQTGYGLCMGLFLWTLVEYCFHRWLFHGESNWMPDNRFVITLHYLLHGHHHAFPMDKYRLVFPPLASMGLYFSIVSPQVSMFVPSAWQGVIAAGIHIGYVCYDMIHYWSHHADFKCSYMQGMKRYHMLHHYRNGDVGFGVSNKMWDYVFQTQIKDA